MPDDLINPFQLQRNTIYLFIINNNNKIFINNNILQQVKNAVQKCTTALAISDGEKNG